MRAPRLASLVSSLGLAISAGAASAQNIFCPAIINGDGVSNGVYSGGSQPFILINGNCTNGVDGAGAFSGAALASQALSTLSQSATNETNRSAVSAIESRRAEEAARCPAGQIRTSAGCEAPRPRGTASFGGPAPTRRPPERDVAPARRAGGVLPRRAPGEGETGAADRRVREKMHRQPVSSAKSRAKGGGPVYESYEEPPVFVIGPRYGAFAQGFGDYERRSGDASSFVQYLNPVTGVRTAPFLIRQRSSTETFGFLAGADMTLRDNIAPGDGAIIGLMAGYTTAQIQIDTRTTSLSAPLPNGSAQTNVRLEGPSVGVYLTYFSGGFSFDQTLKADIYRLSQSFQEFAGFAGRVNGAPGGAIIPLGGAGATDATLFSALGNMNFRFAVADPIWIEPTVGYQYTRSSYGDSAKELNLTDGDRLRLQGGFRVGYGAFLGATRLNLAVTGLAYNNVIVAGGFIAPGIFGSNIVALNDQGKTRGQGIFNLAFDYGNGFQSFIQGDVRGGEGYFGAGGRAGLRYQW